jgi:O6-methylguanine-DNA--protein-cysteine methyltransferase
MKRVVLIGITVLMALSFGTMANAQHRSFASDISRISLPLTEHGEATLKKLEKQIKDCRKNASDDLVKINCHADAFQVNVIQALHALKTAQDMPATGMMAKSRKAKVGLGVGANLG